MGDGPNNRYALVCSSCHSHNGMALRDEFEYISFRCAYCYHLNPARRNKPSLSRTLTPVTVTLPGESASITRETTRVDTGTAEVDSSSMADEVGGNDEGDGSGPLAEDQVRLSCVLCVMCVCVRVNEQSAILTGCCRGNRPSRG